MGTLDWLLLGIVAACAVLAWRTWRKSLKSGGCCGAGCGGDCAHCAAHCQNSKK